MPTQKVLFVINEKSEMERWDISRRKISINQAMIDSLTANMVRRQVGILPMSVVEKDNPGTIGIAIGTNSHFVARMELRKLPMQAPFLVEGTSMYPVFDGVYPIMKMDWIIPKNMLVYLAVSCTGTMDCIDQFLVACDSAKRMWRLPISNLYADCRLCPGRFDGHGRDLIELLNKVWVQFYNGSWNSDLFGDSSFARRNSSKTLFSYKIDNEKIEQTNTPENWHELCEKVSTEFLTQYINY